VADTRGTLIAPQTPCLAESTPRPASAHLTSTSSGPTRCGSARARLRECALSAGRRWPRRSWAGGCCRYAARQHNEPCRPLDRRLAQPRRGSERRAAAGGSAGLGGATGSWRCVCAVRGPRSSHERCSHNAPLPRAGRAAHQVRPRLRRASRLGCGAGHIGAAALGSGSGAGTARVDMRLATSHASVCARLLTHPSPLARAGPCCCPRRSVAGRPAPQRPPPRHSRRGSHVGWTRLTAVSAPYSLSRRACAC
jgi:hypothetical protein